jgi:outer membrane protein TolC
LTEDLSTLDVWSVGGTLSVPIFNGGSTIAGIRSATAARDQATHAFNQAVLDAVSDVQNALARDAENQLRKDAINQSLSAARLAYAESRERYLAGVDPFLSVLTAWNSLQQAELNSLQAHRDVLGARLALIVSLGGTEGAPR